MKEKAQIVLTPAIPVEQLEEGKYYFNNKNELIMIRKINQENQNIFANNVTHHYNLHIRFDRNNLVKKVH